MSPTRPQLRGTFGMAASTHWLASSTAMAVLERGGNAFDAATAAAFVLQVVEPHLNGPGGDASIVLWSAVDAAPSVVCGQGPMPQGATIAHYRGLGLELVPGSGLLAASVPGAFGAWITLLARWGTWELSDVLEYALHYAETGFPILPQITATVTGVRELFTEHWSTSATTWLPGGRVPVADSWWRSPGLADTYRRVIAEAVGPSREARLDSALRAWYDGFVAEEMGRFARTSWLDSSGRPHSGVLTDADLYGWRPPVEAPTEVDVAGRYRVLKTGPWGQGPVLLQQLRLLEALGIHDLQVRSADWVHAVVEASKLAFADREAWYGDPDHVDIPIDALLSREYAAQRALLIGDQASLELRPGSPDGRVPRLPTLRGGGAGTSSGSTGEPTVGRHGQVRGDTVHVDVIDRWGNTISATPSGGWLQSSPTIPALGFPLGSRGQMTHLEQGLAASLRPGARPRTTLSPTLVLRDDQPWLACGTPGGDQQDQWQLGFLLDVLASERDGAADLQAAIDAPSFHSTHFPSSFYPREAFPGEVVVETRFDDEVLADLERRGHRVTRAGDWSLGRLSAIARDADDSGDPARLRAGANPRGAQGYAVGR